MAQQNAPTRRLVGIAEAAAYTGVCTHTIRRYIASGILTGYRLGPRVLRVDLNELETQVLRPLNGGGAA
ncbi:helix-turn-helix transcriptional regulator [Nocardia paucivorans]|uniref:helix-turn-helix transcriptional regulator n=1 Tax=Nocardia paucivorans TaxID=114259 RepID=UPI00059436F3|nr:helix-turn-helix domain-containing protein [Nocardia paucivorans]